MLPDFAFYQPDRLARLRQKLASLATGADVAIAVSALLSEIRAEGDAAVARLTERFDGAKLDPCDFRVPPEQLSNALQGLSPETRQAMEASADAIRSFHEKSRPTDWEGLNPHGATVGERFYPLRRVGLYIPGGQVPLVSTVLMTAIPAMVAGCPAVAVCTPPRPDGSVDRHVLAALALCGVREVYRLGGVQAIGAMGLGTATIPAVDKLFGPGNAYVNEAKRQLFGTCGVDLLPGPSEVLVIADAGAPPAWVAADLIAQAEHGTGKEKVFLVTVGAPDLAEAVRAELRCQIPQRRAAAVIEKVLTHRSFAIAVPNLADAAEAANTIAPEHLELLVNETAQASLLANITTAGAFLCGYHTPTVLGDFAAGPSHTLPTDTTARFSGGIRTIDFMRRSSLVRYHSQAARAAWPTVEAFSQLEQLDGHGASLRLRCP